MADSGICTALLRLRNADDDDAHVVGPAVREGGLDELVADLRWLRCGGFDDVLDLVVAHHLPHAVGAEDEYVFGLQGDLEVVDFDRGMLAEAAVDLVALGMGVDLVVADDTILYQARNN